MEKNKVKLWDYGKNDNKTYIYKIFIQKFEDKMNESREVLAMNMVNNMFWAFQK